MQKGDFSQRGILKSKFFQWKTTHITNNQADTDQFICIENASEKRGVQGARNTHTEKNVQYR